MNSPCRPVRPLVRRSVRIALFFLTSLAVLEPFALAAARPTRLQPKPAPALAAVQQKAADVATLSTSPSADSLGVERVAALDYLYKQLVSGEPFSEEEAKILNNYKAGFEIDTLEADVVISRAIYVDLVQHKPLTRDQQVVYEDYRAWKGVQLHDIADIKRQQVAERTKEWASNPRAPQAPPPNDTCAGAEVVPSAGPFPYLTSTTADITDATTTGDPNVPSCAFLGGPVSRSIWYSFTPSTSGSHTFSVCADAPTATTVNDTVLAVYTSAGGCAGPFTQIACDDDTCATESLQSVATATLTSGTTYYIVVWLYDVAAPTAGNTAVQLRVTAPAPAPANDLCAGATPLPLNTAVQGTLAGAANDYTISTPSATCFPGIGQSTSNTAPGRDVVYSFTPAASGNYSFRMFSRENWISSAVMFLVPGPSCPPAGAIACSATMIGANRQGSSTAFSNVEEIYCAALTAGTTYYIFVDESTLQTTFGAFTIEAFACNRETEPNGTTATANALQCNLEAAINPVGDVDFYSIGTPAAGSRVFAMADGAAGASTDQDMRITTATDTLEYDDANNDVAFGSLSPNCVGTPLTGVASFIRMNHFFPATGTQEPHRIFSVIQPPGAGLGGSSATAETEPNDTTMAANSAANNFFSGTMSGTTDTDLFAFTATAGQVIFLGLDADPLRNNTPINPALALLDSGGTVLISVNDAGFTSSTTSGAGSLTSSTPNSPGEALVFRALTTGTYYARVTMPTGTGGATADYLLSVARDCTIGACTITCPANITVPESSPGSGSATVGYPPPAVLPGCGTVTCVPASGSSFPVGTTTVNCSTTAGPSCSFTVTVTAGCSITCPANITVGNTSGQCGAVVNYPAPTATPGCGTVTCSPASGSTFAVGTTTVTCTTTAGPSCSFTVTVNDTQPPTITCPANITVGNAAGQCSAVVNYTTPAAVDNCPGAAVVCVPASGSTFPVGTTSVTCTATDAAANTAACTFTVTVNDTQAPSIVCPASLAVPASTMMGTTPGAIVNYAAPVVSDNCPGVGAPVCSPSSGSFFPVGVNTVTCSVTDAMSNTSMCTFTITVGTPFGVCVVNDGPVSDRDTLKIVTDPASALYRFWQYTDVSTGTIYQGYAEFLVYVPGRSLVAYDHDSPNVRMDMRVDYARNNATATVKYLTTGEQFTLRDRLILDDPACQ